MQPGCSPNASLNASLDASLDASLMARLIGVLPMVDLAELLADLDAESSELDKTVAALSDVDWSRPTPAAGWTIAHQISHLAWTDRAALLAVTDPESFAAEHTEALSDVDNFVDRAATAGLAPPAELTARWRDGRARLAAALAAMPPGTKAPWFATMMSAASMATARLMETWAHAQDVYESLGIQRGPTDRLRHVAYLGFRTLAHSFTTHGRPVPDEPVRVELTGPDLAFGPADAANRVVGPALDFCLLVTQRRHRADLALRATGPVADEWLDVAQAFAGPPGSGRQPAGATR
jgi:uncharacterized protein (TIGR03084 family)